MPADDPGAIVGSAAAVERARALRQAGEISRPGGRPPERTDHGDDAAGIEHVRDRAKEAADVRVLRLLEGATRIARRVLRRTLAD